MDSFYQDLEERDDDKTVIPQASTPKEDRIDISEKDLEIDYLKDKVSADRGGRSVSGTITKVKKRKKKKKKKKKKEKRSTSKRHREYKYDRLLHDQYITQNETPLIGQQSERNPNDNTRIFFPGLLLGTFLGSMVTKFFLETTSL